MVCSTLWASPFSDREGQLLDYVSADVTSLAGWEEAVDNNQILSVPLTLVGELLAEHEERGVGDALGEAPVFHHPSHVQILDSDYIEPAHEISGDLVHVVSPSISYLGMDLGDSKSGSLSSITSLLTTGYDSLSTSQLLFHLPEVLGVADPLAVREGSQSRDAEINPDLLSSLLDSSLAV